MGCGFSFQKFDYIDQTSSLSEVTLFTPAEDGDYIVSLSGDAFGVNAESQTATVHVFVGWVGNQGTYSWESDISYTGVFDPSGDGSSFTINIHALGGNPVTLYTTWDPPSDPTDSPYYDLSVMIIGG